MPISSASRFASSSSRAGYVSESAVTSTARSPSASCAARASSVESTPPENATTTLSKDFKISSRRSYFSIGALMLLALQPHELVERGVALLNFRRRQAGQAVQRKVLDRERRHDRAVDHRAAHGGAVELLLTGEVSHEPAGERVAGARRIVHGFERERRHDEERAIGHQHRA